jgi:hypothetical protein
LFIYFRLNWLHEVYTALPRESNANFTRVNYTKPENRTFNIQRAMCGKGIIVLF